MAGHLMAARMEKTRHAGIYKHGGRYVFSFRLNGRVEVGIGAGTTRPRQLKAQ